MTETSADLQMQIQEEGSLTEVALAPTPLLQSVEGKTFNRFGEMTETSADLQM